MLCVCVCVHVRARMHVSERVSESRAGGRVECGFRDARCNFDRRGSPPLTLSPLHCRLSMRPGAHAAQPRTCIATRAQRLSHCFLLLRDAAYVPDFLTQRQCSEATISGRDAAILVQSASAALRRHASQWPLR